MGEETREIKDALEAVKGGAGVSALKGLHPADVADIVEELDETRRRELLNSLDTELLAEVLEEMVPETRRNVLQWLDEKKVAEVLGVLPPDAAADVLAELPADKVEGLLAGLKESKAAALRRLRDFPPDTAGGMMTTDILAIPADITAAEALRRIQGAPQFEVIDRIFLIGSDGRFVGLVSPVDILRLPPDARVSSAVRREVPSVTPLTDREEVVRVLDKYDTPVLAVVDEVGRLLGAITFDDVIDALGEEASEDMFRMAGTGSLHPTRERTMRRVLLRLPFLAVTLGGELALAFIAKKFEYTLQEVVSLAFFIPVVNAMGGNVGLQSSTVVVRGIALGEIRVQSLARMLWREMAVGAVIGLICAAAVFGVAFLLSGESDALRVSAAVGVAMFCGVSLAALSGTLIPLACWRLKFDPAIAAGPFITTLNDVTCLTIYLAIATLLLKGLT